MKHKPKQLLTKAGKELCDKWLDFMCIGLGEAEREQKAATTMEQQIAARAKVERIWGQIHAVRVLLRNAEEERAV